MLKRLSESIDQSLEESYSIIEEIQALFPYISSIEQEVYFYLLKTCFYVRKNQYEEAWQLFQDEVIIMLLDSDKEELPVNIRFLYTKLDGIFAYLQGDYDKSTHYYADALELTTNELEQAKLHYNLSLSYWKMGSYCSAIEYAKKAAELYLTQAELIKAGDTYNALGIFYKYTQDYDNAEKYFQKSIHIGARLQNNNLQGKSYYNMGNIYMETNLFERAEECFKYSSQLLCNNQVSYRALMELYLKEKKYEDAKQLLEVSEMIYDDTTEKVHWDVLHGKLILKQSGVSNEYENALIHAIQYFEKPLNKFIRFNYIHELANLYFTNRKYKKSAELYRSLYKGGALKQ